MIVLDTNVLSEPLRAQPDPRVLAWMTTASGLVTTAISVGELLRGVFAMPAGRRREALGAGVASLLDEFWPALLPYDGAAASIYAELAQGRRASGRPLGTEDGMIAAICRSRGALLATRNTKDFADLGVELIDPWA